MSRSYGDKFLLELNNADPKHPGVALAKACVKANLPAKFVAAAMGVTRISIYSWFRGKPLRKKNRVYAEAMTKIITDDMESGRLPAKNVADAKHWARSVVGEE